MESPIDHLLLSATKICMLIFNLKFFPGIKVLKFSFWIIFQLLES